MPDRYGEPLERDDETTTPIVTLPHRCNGGWLDRDADRPRPCLVCKPHLARTRHSRTRPDVEESA